MKRHLLICMLLFCVLCIISACNMDEPRLRSEGQGGEKPVGMPSPIASVTASAVDHPVRFLIPSLHLNAAIEPVGVLPNGEMDTPEHQPWTGVGWYSAGTAPGARGSAVLGGHRDRPGGSPAVFWDLPSLRVGDEVSVLMSSGKQFRFSVVRLVTYTPANAPLQAIFGDGGGMYLNLVTCTGDWLPDQQQTSLRMVVYTSLV